MANPSSLPQEILVEIFSRLPQKTIGKCKCLSKSYLSLFSTPQFLKLCLNHNANLILITQSHSLHLLLSTPILNNDAVSKTLQIPNSWTQVVGSCNGFVLLTNKNYELFLVNPFTSLNAVKIPDSDLVLKQQDKSSINYGFGYDESTDDYKIVTISYYDDGSLVDVYSVKKGFWKRVVWPFNGFVPDNDPKQSGVFVNGAIHWWCYPRTYPPPFFIAAFDLANDVFYEIGYPVNINSMYQTLVAREGRLCIVTAMWRPIFGAQVVWTMEEYGSVESWKDFYIPVTEDWPAMKPLGFVGEDGVVMRARDGRLFWYDVKEGTSKEFAVDGVQACCVNMGQVIKGCDLSIKTMKKGENAVFTTPPELAYGESGSPTTIPPIVKDVCMDGGLFKKILTVGENGENPKDADEVLVNYEAKLENGTLISKSDGVEFAVEEGYFCPAISKAVETMKKGEKVLLTVKPQYGFGENGRSALNGEGAVPPNATLGILLELVSWKIVANITDDKKVQKKILKEGEGYDRPNEGAIVTLKLTGTLQDGTVFFKKGYGDDESDLFEFKTDEEQVVEGLDRAVTTMKKGEMATLIIAPEYAFGSSESQQELATVPPNSTVYYDIELVSFVKDKESCDMNAEEKIEVAGKKKEEGNALFKAGKCLRASKRYEKAAKYIVDDTSFSEEEKKQSKALKLTCNLNDAACKLKLKDYEQAEKICTKVLEIESTNVKALYRRAQAYVNLADLELAEFDIKKALEIDPSNRDVKLEYKALKEKIKEYNKKDAKFYGNMFAKFNKTDSHKQPQRK